MKIKQKGKIHELPILPIPIEERAEDRGHKIGEKQEKEQIVFKMLKINSPTETIEKYVNLTVDQFSNIKREL